MGQLDGKTAVVTGASVGIGLAAVRRFAEEGAFVYMMARRAKELDAAADEIGANVAAVAGDVTDLADLDRLYARIVADGRRVDVLFANAGGGGFVPLAEITEEHLDQLVGLNIRGTLFTVQKALPVLNDGASVILASSIASVQGASGLGVYAASKAAVRSFARTWANELSARHIRVNALAPGTTETPAIDAATPEGMSVAEFRQMIAAPIPLGRIADAAEQAAAALFLASDQSSFVTGIELSVDGGTTHV
ncbi:SDR family oxidoreductase [Actinoplanes sp. TBRC 11911]|uniref:SDR family NAD(P)-dependent oxidoreductase n=1 Tax=Actinoplanes sp. TBRC 11911 TaxID=2729386 RepID=UPI00145D3BE0|nr:SDR family oxidoreductase [Actinoplanes sp. TBRC 11911]NMO55216.1 SDR family oxidoreductase [Actinoplanes sp. TBRC 11911]